MRVNFVLPGFSDVPIGGFKVVYRYANALAERGHTVRVIHPPWCNIKNPISAANFVKQQIKIVTGPVAAYRLKNARVAWFPLADAVEQVTVPDLREQHIPDADATIATAWTTAGWVSGYSSAKGRGYYLIQHFEAFDGHVDAVTSTWRLPLHKIVIAKWLEEKGAELGEADRCTYIPNGIDFDTFRLTKPIAERPMHVTMLGHKALWKGLSDGIEALEIVRGILPAAEATVFGTDLRPKSLPGWIEYVRLPDRDRLTKLYNSSAVFLHTSWSEGNPAPPAEAMACGAALVAAANPGVLDYAEDGVTAMLAPIKSPRSLAEKLTLLFQNTDLRITIAEAGYAHISKYTWFQAEEALNNLLQRGQPT
jgi:glycosyltransferase involved in cell wall biosynthesis